MPLQSEYAGEAQAYYGVTAALWARERTGGQTVEVSLIESLANLHLAPARPGSRRAHRRGIT